MCRLAYAPDGSKLYSVGEDKIVKAWNTDKLTEAKVYPAQPETVTRAPPDNLVALAGSLPRAATDDEIVAHRETVDGAPSPEDAILMMIDAKRRRR